MPSTSPESPALRAELLRWFDLHRRDLPWRRTRDAYAIWVSEVMLQQTQVDTVVPYWHRFLAAFPSVESLACAPLDAVLAHWQGLGYYSRARNLHRAAQNVVSHFGGKVPTTARALHELPGFGRYTSGAVASIAFGEEAPLVDGNVARVFSRLFAVDGRPGDPVRERRLWSLAETWVRGERPGDWNQALMELGALVCRSESPLCLLCPVRGHCAALSQGRVRELPPPKVRAPRRALTLAVAVWRRGDAVLLARREDKGLFGGLWELPSAEVAEADGAERLEEGLQRACGAPVQVGGKLGVVERALTHRDLKMVLFRVQGRARPKAGGCYQELRWARPDEVGGLGMSRAMQQVLKAARADASQQLFPIERS